MQDCQTVKSIREANHFQLVIDPAVVFRDSSLY